MSLILIFLLKICFYFIKLNNIIITEFDIGLFAKHIFVLFRFYETICIIQCIVCI